MSKKNSPKLSPEAAAEQRRLSLAALTAGVSTVNMLGLDLPVAPSVAAPISESETAAPAAAPVPVAEVPAAITPAPKPTAEPAPVAVAAPTIIPVPEAGALTPDAADAPELPTPEPTAPEPVDPVEPTALDLAGLFVPSAEKKGATLRITSDHQQFFAQMGFLLGGGASAPDIIHNILTRFRTTHDAQVQKALQKQMRQMLKKS